MHKPGLSFILVFLVLMVLSSQLFAHPMGNFSISHYARINASSTAISIHAVLDYAEIPTFQMFPETRAAASQIGDRWSAHNTSGFEYQK